MGLIEMDPEEMEAQRQDLERIASFAEKLKELETENLPELTHPFGFDSEGYDNCLREDIVTNDDCAESFAASAPDSKGVFFRTPRTVEE